MCGWQDAWTIEIDGVSKPERFETAEEAQKEIDEYIKEWNEDHDEDDQFEEGTLGIFNADTSEPIG